MVNFLWSTGWLVVCTFSRHVYMYIPISDDGFLLLKAIASYILYPCDNYKDLAISSHHLVNPDRLTVLNILCPKMLRQLFNVTIIGNHLSLMAHCCHLDMD